MTNMSYCAPPSYTGKSAGTSTYCSAGKSSYTVDAARDTAALPETVTKSLGISSTLPAYFAAPSGKADYSGTSPPQHITTPLKPGDLNPSIVLKGSRANL